MEICFEKKCIDIFAERVHQLKSCTETVETVVPDTNDDIARVASLRSMLLLKGKDISSGRVIITGELLAWLLYVSESGAVQSVQLSQEFSIEYEADIMLDEKLSQVKLFVNAAETRVLNPRKVAVTFEICGELRAYSREEMYVSAELRETPCMVYTKYAQHSASPIVCVTEKTFALTEQFTFPDGKPQPFALLSQSVEHEICDIQTIGSRAIIKGSVFVRLCYTAEGVDYPLTTEFSCPFSQLIDVPDTEVTGYAANIEINGAYFSIIDTINGAKAVNVELHCLTELICYGSAEVRYISDMYCNTAELSYQSERRTLPMGCETRQVQLNFSENIDAPEDCSDILAAFTQLSRSAAANGNLSAQCLVDIIYRTGDGGMSVMKRSFELEGDCPPSTQNILHMRIADTKLYPSGSSISVALSIEAACLCCSDCDVSAVISAELDENNDTGFDACPSLTLVRSEGESPWLLAKTYRSSEELILAINGEDCISTGEMLLIPKTK